MQRQAKVDLNSICIDDFRPTSAHERFTLAPVYCLGNCACSSALMLDDAGYGRVTKERFYAVVEAVKMGA